MALKFNLLTRARLKALAAGDRLAEHGITVERTRNGDLRYSVNIMVDGLRIHRVIGKESEGVTREQAERAIEGFRTKAREGRLNLPSGRKTAMTFAEAAILYVSRLEQEGGKIVARKRHHLRERLIPRFGGLRLDAIAASSVNEFIAARRADGAKPGTINRELATLSHMLRLATQAGWLSLDKVPPIKRLSEGPGRIIALSPRESSALLEAAVADQDGDLWLFVAICLQTAMRHGEARRLRWEHFDSHRRRFYIPEAKAGEREQPVTPELGITLTRIREQRGATEGYLFKGGASSTSGFRHTFRKAFQRAVIRAGLDPRLGRRLISTEPQPH